MSEIIKAREKGVRGLKAVGRVVGRRGRLVRYSKTLIMPFSVLFFWVALLLPACYEPQEGCLDVKGTNFDVDADKACGDCCEYPELQLDFQHKFVKGDRTDNLVFGDSVYYDGVGNPFLLNAIQFYISEFHLVRSDGSELGVEEELSLTVWQSNLDTTQVLVEDNFVLANPGVFGTNEIGTIRTTGRFDKIRFKLGLSDTPNRAVISSFSEDLQNHPLAQEEMYWDFDRGYIFNQIELLRDTAANTTPTMLEIGGNQNLQIVELPIDFEALDGFNIRATLRIDYNRWFENIDVKSDSDNALVQKIVANLADSFSLVAIDF